MRIATPVCLVALTTLALAACAPRASVAPKTAPAAPTSSAAPTPAPEKAEAGHTERIISELPARCRAYSVENAGLCPLPAVSTQAPANAGASSTASSTAPANAGASSTAPANAGASSTAPANAGASSSTAKETTARASGSIASASLQALDAAFSEADPLARDRALAKLEACSQFEAGLIRALRAELAPPECADHLVDPQLSDPKTPVSLELSQLMRGQSLGARLLRTEDAPPLPEPPFTREHFETFLKQRIRPWYAQQSQTIYDLASEGARLSGYGKAITAVEAGLSDLRFVDNVRAVPLPEEMAKDHEFVEVYEQGLEDALEPRKLRARDAILVGLLNLGQQGVLKDERLTRARRKLTQLFAGSRVDALDGLLLPELPALSTTTPVERLAAKLPPFFADRLLSPEQAETEPVLRALLERGLPPKLRQHVERRAYERPEIARLYARALLELGSKYFRPADFTRATIILGTKGALIGPEAKETRLIAAITHALEGGPSSAVELMLTGPLLPDGMGKIDQLERMAKETGPLGGLAAYDAAHLMTVIPQREPNAEHWEKAAKLFDDAARKLTAEAARRTAKTRAEDARATARQIRSAKPQPNDGRSPNVAPEPPPSPTSAPAAAKNSKATQTP
ncbi:MAG: hypothetical protein QM784_01865 [Polyangiaceae bacterium]